MKYRLGWGDKIGPTISIIYMIQNALDTIATTNNSKNEKNRELEKGISKSSLR